MAYAYCRSEFCMAAMRPTCSSSELAQLKSPLAVAPYVLDARDDFRDFLDIVAVLLVVLFVPDILLSKHKKSTNIIFVKFII